MASNLPINRFLVELSIPDSLWRRAQTVTPADGWDAIPEGAIFAQQGDAWVRDGQSALLWVPSVIVPEELCLLINPARAEAKQIAAHVINLALVVSEPGDAGQLV